MVSVVDVVGAVGVVWVVSVVGVVSVAEDRKQECIGKGHAHSRNRM